MNSTTQFIMSIKPWAFLAIVTVSIICAIVRCKSLGTTRDYTSYSTVPSNRSFSASPSTRFSYVASGTSPVSQRSYLFDICKAYDGYRAYIVQSPSYGSRATDGHSTHRHYDGRYYICWDTPVESYDGMVAIAKAWSDGSQKYIEQGITF